MHSLFNDLAVLENVNSVSLFHRAKPVGNYKRGATFKKLPQLTVQARLGFRVQRGGRFIENHHFGIAQYHAGDRQTLFLATG